MTARLTAPVPKTIVLIGLMGAGKSCIGRLLAQRLGLKFIDADKEIENAAQCSIAETFERHGEAAFREGERRVIARLLDGPVHVLAAGGGAFMNQQTRAKIRERGIAVWLRADLDLLVRRVSRRRNRPLLKHGKPRQILKRLMAERYPVYAEANIAVDTSDQPPEVIVDQVIEALETYINASRQAQPRPQPRRAQASTNVRRAR